MLYYPQLISGSVCQFPVVRRAESRTIANELLGGSVAKMADRGAAVVRWQLSYTNMTDAEWNSIQQLFESAEGRLSTFTFLDPTDNLLTWSEDWTQSTWAADPLLSVSEGIQDPAGANGAIQVTNQSQTTQRIVQTIEGPSWFQYCFSVFVRSEIPSTAQLVIATSGQESLQTVQTDGVWRRVTTAGRLSASEGTVSFGVQLPPGARLCVFGAQVEAQPAAGSYKKTTDRGGVYSSTRFDSDSLTRTAEGPGRNSCVVSLVAKLC